MNNQKHMKKIMMSSSIINFTLLKLSKWGQIRLSAFPDHIISYVAEFLLHPGHPEQQFQAFFAHCEAYSFEKCVNPNWERAADLAAQFNMPENAKNTIDSFSPLADLPFELCHEIEHKDETPDERDKKLNDWSKTPEAIALQKKLGYLPMPPKLNYQLPTTPYTSESFKSLETHYYA